MTSSDSTCPACRADRSAGYARTPHGFTLTCSCGWTEVQQGFDHLQDLVSVASTLRTDGWSLLVMHDDRGHFHGYAVYRMSERDGRRFKTGDGSIWLRVSKRHPGFDPFKWSTCTAGKQPEAIS